MKNDRYPTPWQKKVLWSALTALGIVTIGGIGVGGVWLIAQILSFLQPILIPFAVAGVLAYLLDPVVTRMLAWGVPRQFSVLTVFALVSALLLWGAIWFVPAVTHQTVNLLHKVDDYTRTTRTHVTSFAHSIRQKYGFDVLPSLTETTEEDNKFDEPKTPAIEGNKTAAADPIKTATSPKIPGTLEELVDVQKILKGDWLKNSIILLINNSIRMVRSSVGGFLSVFGFLLSLIIIPIYLYYFLIDARTISNSWQDYLPVRASKFKDELVSTLTEINGYVIAFFRGQLLVSLINGTATAMGLVIIGLDFGLLIGLVLCVLGLIPYMGILICWIPALIIATVQGDVGTWIPADPGWLFPTVVTGIFVVVQKFDSFYITPRVVASTVGLHPLTVIVSLFVWSLIIGGLLGTILAVPLTATLKVLLRRYVWERRLLRLPESHSPDATDPHQPIR
jgi:predicted PurR-regulated permease PerM